MKDTFKESVVIVIVCGITSLFYKYSNPYKDIERFYHSQNKFIYYLFNLSYIIIMIALALNIRNILIELRSIIF